MPFQSAPIWLTLTAGLVTLSVFIALVFLSFRELLDKGSKFDLHSHRLLSPAEAAFYKFLSQTIQSRYLINCHTPIDEILSRGKGERMSNRLYSMYKGGHIDFLLLHPLSTEPILAIELDDSTHMTPATRDRDSRKEKLLSAANLPIVRIPLGDKWGEAERRTILEKLGEQSPTSLSEKTVIQNAKTRPRSLA